MSSHRPDLWALVEVTHGDEKHVRVMGSWYGGFAGSNSWRLSSGLTGAALAEGGGLALRNESGSVYHVGRGNYGLSGYSAGVLASYREEGAQLRELDEAEALRLVDDLIEE
jgi:hypothetical protein